VPPETPAANLALRLSEELAEQGRRLPGAPEDELAKSRERELSAKLKELLLKDCAQWRTVFGVLEADDPQVARRIVALIREAVDAETERDLIGKMQAAERHQTRRLALDLLCGRSSNASLMAVAEAVRRDRDIGVRYAALSELAMRKTPSASPETAAMIDQAILERAQVDPSPEVRMAALRISGQAPPQTVPPPTQPRKTSAASSSRFGASDPKPAPGK
jgi:hypothetical protein